MGGIGNGPGAGSPGPRRPVDLLVTRALVLTMDDSGTVVPDGALAIDGGSIAAVGRTANLEARYAPVRTIDAAGGLAMPGLVNAHAHLATVMFRGLAEDLSLERWLRRSWALERAFVDEASVGIAARLGILESISAGVTCAVDMYWFPHAAALAALELGFRLANGPVLLEVEGAPDGLSPGGREAYAREFVERFRGERAIHPMVMPHGTGTDSPESLSRAKALADRLGLPLHLHAAETAAERAAVSARHGASPLRLLDGLGLLDGRVLLAHCVHVDAGEIELLAARGAAVAHNPASNLKLASGTAPVAAMAAAGVRVGLGTDGAMSGNDLDPWKAMRLAALLQKAATGDPAALPAESVVRMATIEGARALGLGGLVGSLEPGKRADLVILDLGSPHMLPLHDPYAQLVYAAGREDVRTVLVEGRPLLLDGAPLTADPAALAEAATALAARIRAGLPSRA